MDSPAYDYDANTWPHTQDDYAGYRDDWVWACGPEAGKVFYTNKVYVTNQNYRADGMYSSWSNPVDCRENGIPIAYADDYEPNNQNSNNHKTSTNYNTATSTPCEYYTQYTGRYVWNDAHEKYRKDSTQDRWRVHYYVVEFTPYENTETGEKQVPTAPRLHAEQTYE